MASVTEDRVKTLTVSAAWNGTGTAPAGTQVAVSAAGSSVVGVQVTGTMTATLQFEGIVDETNGTWFAVPATPITSGASVTSATAAGRWLIPNAGLSQVRVRCSAYTSGSPIVCLRAAAGSSPAAAGAAAAGAVTISDGADIAQGTTTDAAITTDASGTVIGFLRGLVKMFASVFPAVAALADGVANPTLSKINTYGQLFNGTTWDRARDIGGANATLLGVAAVGPCIFDTVNVVYRRCHAAISATAGLTGIGVQTVAPMVYDGNAWYLAHGNSAGAQFMAGDIASGATDSGNPVKIGTAAVAHGATPTAVSAGQRANMIANRHGIPFHIGGHPNIVTVRATYSAAQTNTVVVANAAGTKIVVTGFMATVDNATTVNVQVRIGLAQSVTPTTTGVFGSHPGVAAGSGFGRGGGEGMLAVGADGDQILLTSGAATTGNLDIVCEYYAIAS